MLKNMNLARAIILLSILGSLALGWMSWTRNQKLTELEFALKNKVPDLGEEIQMLAARHTLLAKERSEDGMVGQDNAETYIYEVAANDRVAIGDTKITPSEAVPRKGVVDKKYRIRPSDRERPYRRKNISNFFYRLEEKSRRVKVTDIKIEPAQKRLKDHEIPEDRWTFDVEITSRENDSTP